MKKINILLACIFLLVGCTSKTAETVQDTSNGPVVTEDERSNDEKILAMIQACIKNYNEDDINELREYYKSDIPSLPIEITSLPEISSLDDLTKIENDENSNTVYEGMYVVNDKYNVIFKIYYASGSDFWPNGEIAFQIDSSNITVNDSQYEGYRTSLEYLLSEESNVIDMLYGSSAVLNEDSVIDERYYEVVSINDTAYTTIQELKDYAESVFTTEYLEENYYKNAFESEYPVYKESNGKLYCLGSEVTPLVSYTYAPEYIIAVKDENGTVKVNLLTKVMDNIIEDIKEVTLQETENGYRLASAG